MLAEINLLGVYAPGALVWGVLAVVIVYLLRVPLQRLPLERFLWHPSLLELALFVLVWLGLSAAADKFLTSSLAF